MQVFGSECIKLFGGIAKELAKCVVYILKTMGNVIDNANALWQAAHQVVHVYRCSGYSLLCHAQVVYICKCDDVDFAAWHKAQLKISLLTVFAGDVSFKGSYTAMSVFCVVDGL